MYQCRLRMRKPSGLNQVSLRAMWARSCARMCARSPSPRPYGRYILGRNTPSTKGEAANSLSYTSPSSRTAVLMRLRRRIQLAKAQSSMSAMPMSQTSAAMFVAVKSGLAAAGLSGMVVRPAGGATSLAA